MDSSEPHRQDKAARSPVTNVVRDFYDEMPFNYSDSDTFMAKNIQAINAIEASYPSLHEVLLHSRDKVIADIGCGAGWFANSVAHHYGIRVRGFDISGTAIRRAHGLTCQLNLESLVCYCKGDLFFLPFKRFYIANSIGVLHHTHDCRKAFEGVAELVEPGGYLHVGLYHKYGREPFLKLFQPYIQEFKEQGDLHGKALNRAFQQFKRLNKHISDDTFLRSWFRDQVLHPFESQHTLQEVHGWLCDAGLSLISTSINRFGKIDDLQQLFSEEKRFREISYQRNVVESEYFPGFFSVLARREQ